jgi:hypothetical protein
MCDKCVEIDKKIAQYNRFLMQSYDPLTEQRMKVALAELEQCKAELH